MIRSFVRMSCVGLSHEKPRRNARSANLSSFVIVGHRWSGLVCLVLLQLRSVLWINCHNGVEVVLTPAVDLRARDAFSAECLVENVRVQVLISGIAVPLCRVSLRLDQIGTRQPRRRYRSHCVRRLGGFQSRSNPNTHFVKLATHNVEQPTVLGSTDSRGDISQLLAPRRKLFLGVALLPHARRDGCLSAINDSILHGAAGEAQPGIAPRRPLADQASKRFSMIPIRMRSQRISQFVDQVDQIGPVERAIAVASRNRSLKCRWFRGHVMPFRGQDPGGQAKA